MDLSSFIVITLNCLNDQLISLSSPEITGAILFFCHVVGGGVDAIYSPSGPHRPHAVYNQANWARLFGQASHARIKKKQLCHF